MPNARDPPECCVSMLVILPCVPAMPWLFDRYFKGVTELPSERFLLLARRQFPAPEVLT